MTYALQYKIYTNIFDNSRTKPTEKRTRFRDYRYICRAMQASGGIGIFMI